MSEREYVFYCNPQETYPKPGCGRAYFMPNNPSISTQCVCGKDAYRRWPDFLMSSIEMQKQGLVPKPPPKLDENLLVVHRGLKIIGVYEKEEEAEEAQKQAKNPCSQVADAEISTIHDYGCQCERAGYDEASAQLERIHGWD